MNRGKRSLNNKIDKKMKKSIRLGQNAPSTHNESVVLPDQVIAQQMERRPLTPDEKDKKLFQAAKKFHAEEKVEKHHKVSKRTTPGEVSTCSSAPHNVHIEGERWLKTIEKQILSENKTLTKKLSKKKLPLRKKGISFK
jgi:hypothetical protein